MFGEVAMTNSGGNVGPDGDDGLTVAQVIKIVADAIEVLHVRDGLQLLPGQADERARNIVAILSGLGALNTLPSRQYREKGCGVA